MYAASQAFHDAVRNGNHQMPLLIFNDAVFTQTEIDVDMGIEFDDNFNMEEDMAIGQATSNEIRFTLINASHDLDNYEFGEFIATIGVEIGRTQYTHSGTVKITTPNATYIGNSTTPYITRNGVTLTRQPTFPVMSLMYYDNLVWCFGSNGEYAIFNDTTGLNVTTSRMISTYMRNRTKVWGGTGFVMNNRILTIYKGGIATTYEFVPLGVFIADRPNVPDQLKVDFTCYDRMTKFDKDMPTAEQMGITYPTTIGQLFVKLCQYADVPYRTSNFLNSMAEITKEPQEFKTSTMRQVLMWIAEAAGSNARFDRDGYLILDWLKLTVQSYDEHDYIEFMPYWYETERVGQVNVRETSSGREQIVGSGVAYLIQDNPLIKGSS